jgi:tetratricopeptide (TPR) repeat protein/transcriptional regulator with XRE-family HTH domain
MVVNVRRRSESSGDPTARVDGERAGTAFPAMLRQRRVAAWLTQEQLGERAGLTARSVSQLERGRVRFPRPETVRLLGQALGMTAHEIAHFQQLARVDYWTDRAPRLASTAPGDGPSSITIGTTGDTPADMIRLAHRRFVPAQLPGDVGAFTGRRAELARLDTLLTAADNARPGAASRTSATAVVISAVSGTAGVGKTALALHWAHRVAARFPDGQLYVNLRGYDPQQPLDPADVLTQFLHALGVAGDDVPADRDERAARYRTELAGRRMLIVVDNAATVEQVRPLLPGTATAAVVVTSRDSLAGLVAVHGAHRVDLDLLPAGDAVALLRRLIGRRVETDAAAAAGLAEQCARLPLALRVAAELAAARPDSPLHDLTTELADEQRRLDLLDAGGDPRGAVTAVFSWSYRHLAADMAGLFRLLGLHPGPDIDTHAAAAFAGGTVDDTRRQLAALARAHLVAPTGPGRYSMHDLLRAYAASLATGASDEPQRHAMLSRLFEYYLAAAAVAMDRLYPAEACRRPRVLPAAAVPDLATLLAARTWLDTEGPNLTAIAAHTATHGWATHTIDLSSTLYRHLDIQRPTDALIIHGYAVKAAQAIGDRAGRAHALTSLGVAHAQIGQRDQAATVLRQALAEFRQIDDGAGTARAQNNLGCVEYRLGQYSTAAERFTASAEMARRNADPVAEARALSNLGQVKELLGQHAAAADHLRRALCLNRSVGEHVGQVQTLNNLGVVLYGQGQHGPAAEHHNQALKIAVRNGDRYGEAYALIGLGDVHVRLGRPAEATEQYNQALALMRKAGDRDGEAWASNGLAEAALAAGRPRQALAQHTAALAAATDIGNGPQQARAHDGLARIHHGLGDHEAARTNWQHAISMHDSLGLPNGDRIRANLRPRAEPSHGPAGCR